MPLKELRSLFPKLKATKDTIKSPVDIDYNCAGWALSDKASWWEPWGGLVLPSSTPQYKWSSSLPHDTLAETYVRFFEEHGFELTDSAVRERGFERLAVYVRDGEFTHVARQLPNGRWTSKLGDKEDIEHAQPEELENDGPFAYGRVALYMKRKRGA